MSDLTELNLRIARNLFRRGWSWQAALEDANLATDESFPYHVHVTVEDSLAHDRAVLGL